MHGDLTFLRAVNCVIRGGLTILYENFTPVCLTGSFRNGMLARIMKSYSCLNSIDNSNDNNARIKMMTGRWRIGQDQ
jgi:hypothetical protein